LRTDCSGDPTFRELLGRVREVALGAYAHQDVPFERLVEELTPERDLARHPLFQVMFSYQHADHSGPADLRFGGGSACRFGVRHAPAIVDVVVALSERGGSLEGTVQYSTELFDRATTERLARQLVVMLERAVDDPGAPLSAFELLNGAEREQLERWGRGEAAGPQTLVPDAIWHDRDPQAVAVVDANGSLTYAQLDARVNAIAAAIAALPAGESPIIGISLHRGVDVVASLLAAWRAGCAWMMLDPLYPTDRLAYMAADAPVSAIISDHRLIQHVQFATVPILWLDELGDRDGAPPGPANPRPGATACVIYTSGSTGRPKGVEITHANLAWVLQAWRVGHRLEPTSRWLTSASVSFDVFAGDVVRALGTGGALVIAPSGIAGDPAAFANLIANEQIGALELSPFLLRPLLDHLQAAGTTLGHVRHLVVASEPWSGEETARLHRLLPSLDHVICAYGVTEATVDSTFHLVPGEAQDGILPMGGPLPGARVRVLDPHLRPVPPGVPGELFIGGGGVAHGYAGRPALTAERFVADPVAGDGSLLYRTGDRVRWRPDGELEFLGRLDDQLNVRGHRIEPGEVEAALLAHPAVAEAAVTQTRLDDGGAVLTAHLVGRDGRVDSGEVRRHLEQALPRWMVPTLYRALDCLPRLPNGKIDRRALVALTVTPPRAPTRVAPRTPTETAVADAWVEVLGRGEVGVDDSFFEVGGHSLLATRLVARLAARFGVELPIRSIFEHPTVAEQAEAIEEALLDAVETVSDTEAERLLGFEDDE
jgi:amino acid adenylation domain-containing protein